MNSALILALQLLLAHVMTDFLFQSKKWIKQKRRKKHRSLFLYIHVLIAGILTYLIVHDWTLWWPPVVIIVTHYLIDLWKLNRKEDDLKIFLIDQMLHLLVLFVVWLILTDYTGELFPFLASLLDSDRFLVIVTGYLMVIFPFGFIIGKATQRWQKEIKKEDGIKSLEKAGRYIGIFERVLVLTFILLNNIAAIGLLIAAKSILRFSDKSKSGARKQTEYVLIGTLMSFALTIITGLLMRQFLFQ